MPSHLKDKTMNNTVSKLLLLGLVILISSCASRKDIVYMQDATNFETLVDKNSFTPKFKVDDVISIYVSTLNSEASAPFNLFVGSTEPGGRAEQVDYLVDKHGEIEFPVLGKLKVVGLSAEELRVMLREKLSADYLKDPIINIRLRNFTISVLGQVNRPGTYEVIGERITIFEALGLAGDMTIKGRRDNVLVTRDFDGAKVLNRIDLTSKDAMNSPVYYLTQNDVVYVEPNRSAITSSSLDNRANLTISILSLLITSSIILITRN